MIDLTDKVCLVTGATGGIGQSITRTLARQGARVVVHCHANADGARELAAACGDGRAHVVRADLAARDGAFALWRDALAWTGHVDVVINNAGIMPAAPLTAEPDAWHDAWDATLRVNLVAAADICREAVKHFGARGGGIVINIASRAAFRGDSLEYMAYAASKAGLVALTRSIARGSARDGVLAYVVAPGFVDAGMARSFIAEYGVDAITRDIPLGEMATAADVSNVVAFLASGLARHATGTTIDINGASYVR